MTQPAKDGDGWNSVKKYKITKMLNDLSKISGHGTELVTVYIPPRRPMHDILSQLRNEAGTATNIKSDLTRTHVQDALSKTMEQLKLYKETPENGLVIFCGAIPTGKGIGTEKIEIYPIIPPKPVQINLYRCDDHFWIDHIKEMLKDEKVIGIISGGPGPTKDNFLKEEYLDYRLQNNVISTLDTSYSGDEGVREIIDKVNDQGIMSEFRLMEEKKLVKNFMREVYYGKGLAIYGINDVLDKLKSGIADLIIVTDDINLIRLESVCKKCNNSVEKITDAEHLVETKQSMLSKTCINCSGMDFLITEKDIIDFLEELSALSGTRIEIISSKTEEGNQIQSLGKIGALLRFKPID